MILRCDTQFVHATVPLTPTMLPIETSLPTTPAGEAAKFPITR